jgi:MFS family permease
MSRRRAALAAVLTAGFLGEFAFALLLLPLLQHYLPTVRGLSAALPGYILAVYGFSRLLAQVPLGAIADVLDRRLAVAAGYLAALAAGLIFWPPVPVALLIAAAALFGLGHALADPLIPAGLAAGAEADELGRILALLNLAQVAGLVVGLGGGAFIVDLAPASAGFLVVAVANGLTLLLLVASAPVLGQGHRPAERLRTASVPLRSLASERAGFLLCTLFMLALAVNLLTPDLNLFVVNRLRSSLHVMTLYLIPAGIVGVAALPLGGWIADRAGRLPPLLGGAGVAALSLGLLTHITVPWQAAIAATLAAGGVALTMPASNAALLDLADPNHRALLLSGMMALQGLAEAIGPFLSGLLIVIGGAGAPVAAASLSLCLVVPCTVLYASSPQGDQQGEIVPYTPLTRLVSRAHLRAHAWRLERQSQQPVSTAQHKTAHCGE